MTKRMLVMLVLAGCVFGGIIGFQAFKARMVKQYLSSQGQPAQTVSTTTAHESAWQPAIRSVGTLRAERGADIAPEVAGVISAIHFRSGDEVQVGAPLVQLNDASERAQLASLVAAAQLAAINYRRDVEQLRKGFVTQSVVDTDAANLKVAQAHVAEQQALLDKKLVRAPFAGRLGIRAVDLGQYVAAGTKLVTLQSLDPILVDFSLPQSELAQVAPGRRVSVSTDALPGERFAGTVEAIDAKLDPATRNVLVRASVGNPQHHLLPGMFVDADVSAGETRRYLTLPQTAITFNPYGNTVFVVTEKGKRADGKPQLVAAQRFVTTGPTRGDQIAVLSGLAKGETIVTAGQLKLRNGMPVRIDNSIQPANEPNPQPKDPT